MACSHPSRLAPVLLVAALVGCTEPEPIDSSDGGTTSTTSTTATTEATLGASSSPPTSGDTTLEPTATSAPADATASTDATATATTDTGPAPACPDDPAYQCTDPVDCSTGFCGTPFSIFDADGCLRPSCSLPQDCDPGFACLRSQDYGGCESSGLFCEDDRNGECICSSTPDCSGGHCLPDDEVPPLECFGLPDEPTCLDANCSHFELVTEISDTCECTPGVPACVLFVGPFDVDVAPDYFWHEATGTVALFGTSWDWPPVGWRPCTDPGAPAACGCYEPLMAPDCP